VILFMMLSLFPYLVFTSIRQFRRTVRELRRATRARAAALAPTLSVCSEMVFDGLLLGF
jgi:hypothetical protein